MPRTRFAISALAVAGLVAGACGNDDTDPAEQEDAVRSAVAEITEQLEAPQPDPDAAPDPDPDAAPDPDLQEAPGTVSTLGQLRSTLGQLRLGNRFEWCGYLQNAWDQNVYGLHTALASVADYSAALAALDNAIDELDRAEALEKLDAVDDRARATIDEYTLPGPEGRPGFGSLLSGQIRLIITGSEGTQGVAYARAREAFEANASREESILLREFPTLFGRNNWDRNELVRLSSLELPAGVQAAVGVIDALRERPYAFEPWGQPANFARDAAAEAFSKHTTFDGYSYAYDRGLAGALYSAAEAEVNGHIYGGDYRAAVAAVETEADRYRSAAELAYAAAIEASNTIYEAAFASHDVSRGRFYANSQVKFDARQAANIAAYDAVLPYAEALEAAFQAVRPFWLDESTEIREAVEELAEESRAAGSAAREEFRRELDELFADLHRAAVTDFEAARDAAEAAADERLASNALEAAAETRRVSRAEGFAATIAADTVLAHFESGDITDHWSVNFLLPAVSVEILLRSDAWAALQQSLTEACRQ